MEDREEGEEMWNKRWDEVNVGKIARGQRELGGENKEERENEEKTERQLSAEIREIKERAAGIQTGRRGNKKRGKGREGEREGQRENTFSI